MQTIPTSTRQQIFSPNFGGMVTVSSCGWSREAEAEHGIDAIIAGDIAAERWVATSDGRGYIAEWHEGPEADAVYVERHDVDGRGFHGWIDSVSRRIVQAG